MCSRIFECVPPNSELSEQGTAVCHTSAEVHTEVRGGGACLFFVMVP